MQPHDSVEKSIIKKFRKDIWKKFTAAINDYELIREGDKIAVCMSGGKDSFLLAKCMQELKRHGKFPFELEFLVMDPGYNPANRQLIEENAHNLNIPIRIFETNIFDVVVDAGGSPCYLCARMRRGYLYKHAQELGCNKIALGHHMDDVIETVLLSMFYGSEIKTMMPKLHSANFEGMELIRPMYMIRESDIIAWKNYNELRFLQCACRFTEACAEENNETTSKRKEMKALIEDMRKVNPNVDFNIFKSLHNVNLDAVLGYSKNREKHSFLDEYEDHP